MIRLKWHESWLHDSFLSLDPELIEKNHGTAQKNMHRCVRAFEKLENEGCTQIAAAIKQQVGDFVVVRAVRRTYLSAGGSML
jgi:hypothetical protein